MRRVKPCTASGAAPWNTVHLHYCSAVATAWHSARVIPLRNRRRGRSSARIGKATRSGARTITPHPIFLPRPRSTVWCTSFRSEEHTSELQSHLNLLCRLLLEKKKCHKTIVHNR